MRIVDRATARDFMKYLNKARSDYANTNEKIASGKRFTKMSEDVVAGTRVLRARTDMCKAETHLGNIKAAKEELSSAELAMTSINGILVSVKEKVLAAMSEEKGETGRQMIALEIGAVKDQLLQYANSKYNSRYVFGGSNASYTAPFTIDSSGRLLYNGVPMDSIQKDTDGTYFYDNAGVKTSLNLDSDVYFDIGLGIKLNGTNVDPNTGFKVSYSGMEVLGFGKNSDGLSNNIYNVITDIIDNIRNYNSTELNKLYGHLEALSDSFRANLTLIGAKSNLLETMEGRLNGVIDGYTEQIHNLMGINDAEETMNQSMNEYVLKAVIRIGANILPITLMDFLK